MDTPFHFGIIPHLEASHRLFEEFNRGKARTESVLQAMKDGDFILVYGKEAARDIEDRLHRMGKHRCEVIIYRSHGPQGGPEEFHPEEIRRSLLPWLKRRPQNKLLHVDHTFIYAWTTAQLYALNDRFAGLVGLVGEFNISQAMAPEPSPSLDTGEIMELMRKRDPSYQGKHTIPMTRVVTEDDIDIREPKPAEEG